MLENKTFSVKYKKNLENIKKKTGKIIENFWERILKKYKKVFEEIPTKFRVPNFLENLRN